MKESTNFWENKYIERNTPWDKATAAPPLKEFLDTKSISGKALIPGCGRGHDVRLLAQHGVEATGLDIAPTAIQEAHQASKYSKERYLLGDFFDLPETLFYQFDWLFEHTCFCAIPRDMRQQYVKAAHLALKPKGKVLAIFFLITENDDSSHPPFSSTPEEIDSLFHPYFETIESWTPQETYPSRPPGCEQMRLLRKKGAS